MTAASERQWAYQSLHHEHPLLPEAHEELVHIDRSLGLDPLQHGVQQDEGAGAAHARTAVHQQRNFLVLVVCLLHSPDEGDEGGGKPGHTVVWPGGEVVLGHRQRLSLWLSSLGQQEHMLHKH